MMLRALLEDASNGTAVDTLPEGAVHAVYKCAAHRINTCSRWAARGARIVVALLVTPCDPLTWADSMPIRRFMRLQLSKVIYRQT